MAAISSQPWHLLLLMSLLLLFSFTPFCHTQSDSPRNIETFFPIETIPSSPPTPLPPPPSTSDRGKIIRAVLITAATTSVVAATFFCLLQRCITARRRRDRISNANSFESFSFARPATGGGRGGATQPVLDREEFTRFNGNVKGLIVDEDGLDVLYWRKLHERNKSESFRKENLNRAKGDYEEEDEKQVIVSKKKQKAQPVQEIPLLRGKSSSSYSPFHQEGYHNINTFNTEAKSQQSDPSHHQPPPPPIPAKQSLSPPPPPPPAKFKTAPSPPPPPPPKAAMALTLSSSKPPPVPKSSSVEASNTENGKNGQVKLKPLHWDKVNPDSDHSMVWDKIDHGSFRFDGDLMEALFGYVATNKSSPREDDNRNPGSSSPEQIFILEPRKSQNTAIMLKSLSVSREELVEALLQGQDFVLDTLERLARIAPTQEEQKAILDFEGDPKTLADADAFLFHLLKAIPSAFIRLNALLFKSNYQPEIAYHKKNIDTLLSACKELKARGLFMKLLEAVLKAGNRMNAGTARGNAQAFNLTALRKLSDVKSVDGKTSLLHFVVEQVVRSEGKKCVMNKKNINLSHSGSSKNGSTSMENSNASEDEQEKEYVKLGLPVVGGLSAQFSNVKKAAAIEYEAFSATCSALSARAKDTRRALGQCERDGGEFMSKIKNFVDSAEEEVQGVSEDQIKATDLVKRTTEYYQAGALNDKNPLQLFVIIKDFLGMVDKVCLEIARNLQNKRPGASGSPLQKNAVKFPVLPPNFMSDRSRRNSSGSDNNL